MKVVIKKWGNSASVRIPAAVMAAARLTLDASVDVREEGGRIIVAENLHSEIDFGEPMGKEAL
jgi:antitoxin MazE